MAKRLTTFSRNLAYAVRDMARAHRTYRARRQPFEPLQNSAFVAIAKTPEAGIPARAGIVFGSADCKFLYLDKDDQLVDWDTADEAVEEIFNPYYFDIPGNIEIDIDREVFSGRPLVRLKGGFYGIISTTITGRSGTTLGTGAVDLHQEDPATGELTDLNSTQPVFNSTQGTGAVGKFIQVKISAFGALMWDVYDCSP